MINHCGDYTGKILSALRNQFGGHEFFKKKDERHI
jgi:6-phosphogluconate dehydrogenase (decarboxylating)